MPRAAPSDSGSLPIQIRTADKERLMRAAALEQSSLKDFVLRNALRAAEAVIDRAERIHLDAEQSRFIMALLDDPPAPTSRLVAAARAEDA